MRKYLNDVLNLRQNTDFDNTRLVISDGISLRGYNLWILVCSTILASIGLDTNSTAVIIGAMLISPLMSPILGVGLSVAIHDRQVLTSSLKNLLVAVLISLGASITYFFVSPLGQPTPELQARTFPTLLDVMIALFGGIAGIVSISRQQQTNTVPGVAIATALMPPLCTAGFGIATANWNYFFGAFYLFFINAIFISLATYLIVRYLNFPQKEFVNTRVARQYRRWFLIISTIVFLPSVYLLYSVYQDEVIKKEIGQLVLLPIKNQGNEILKWDVVTNHSTRLIKVYHSGTPLSDSLKKSIARNLVEHNMTSYELMSMRVNLTKEEVNELSAETARQMFQAMHLEEIAQPGKNITAVDSVSYPQVLKEVRIAFPFVDTLSHGWISGQKLPDNADTLPIVLYHSLHSVSKSQNGKLYKFLLARLRKDSIVLIKR